MKDENKKNELNSLDELGAVENEIVKENPSAMNDDLSEPAPAMEMDDDFVIGKGFFLDDSKSATGELFNAEQPGENFKLKKGKKGRKKKGKRGCLSTFAWIMIVIIVIPLSLAAVAVIGVSDYLGIGKDDFYQVTIERGATTEQIADQLKESGAIRFPLLFRLYTKYAGYDGTFQYGSYEFDHDTGYELIADTLQTQGSQADAIEIRIPEMATIDDIIKIMADNSLCTSKDFQTAVRNGNYTPGFVSEIPKEKLFYRLEGYLFPDTYQFLADEDSTKNATRAIEKMLKRMDQVFTAADLKQIENLNSRYKINLNVHKILTMASIIEMESSSHPDEMANVASVFYNRLTWDEPKLLGSSPTIDYAKKYGEKYDTNKYEGLPPGPMCAPSEKAIKAALYPAENFEYTYFVTDSDMKFYYNKTLEEHNKTIKDLKAKGKWIG